MTTITQESLASALTVEEREKEKSYSEDEVVEFIETSIKALEATDQTSVTKKT